ncbi:hypothetical protein ACHAXA_001663 [Cyclostephanos tholiformis]|uniref:Uncharacterized protein n=1 Tax=Cyclostephanos tholiformis TaxID=382380 RepID=A0ABD3RCX2_9STRA
MYSLLSLVDLDSDLRLIDPLLASAGNNSEFNDWEAAEVLDFDFVDSLLSADLDPDLRLIDPLLASAGNNTDLDPDLRLIDPLLASAGNKSEFNDWEAAEATAPSLADSKSLGDSSDDSAPDSSSLDWLACDCPSRNSFFLMDLELRRFFNSAYISSKILLSIMLPAKLMSTSVVFESRMPIKSRDQRKNDAQE